jgi:hypothetical protein
MTTSDWVWGPGGKDHAPVPPFQFVKENTGGTTPKVDVRDANGALWTVKFGGEVHAEVFASRLLLALGYPADPTYFVADGVIDSASGLHRAKPFVGKDGHFRNARFKLRDKSKTYANEYHWSWVENPFLGSHELGGLRIVLMLASNWDTKDARDGDGSNTAVLREGSDLVYAMTDWGSAFGKWGGFFQRTRWDAAAYAHQSAEFVRGVKDGRVVWGFQGKHGADVTTGITVDDVRWLLPYLTAISEEQLQAGLKASGASPVDARKFSAAIQQRIAQLQQIAR